MRGKRTTARPYRYETFIDWHTSSESHVNEFIADVAAAASKQLQMVPPSQRPALKMLLQDQCSLYSPYMSGIIESTPKEKL